MLKNDILLTIGGEIALYFFSWGGERFKTASTIIKKTKNNLPRNSHTDLPCIIAVLITLIVRSRPRHCRNRAYYFVVPDNDDNPLINSKKHLYCFPHKHTVFL